MKHFRDSNCVRLSPPPPPLIFFFASLHALSPLSVHSSPLSFFQPPPSLRPLVLPPVFSSSSLPSPSTKLYLTLHNRLGPLSMRTYLAHLLNSNDVSSTRDGLAINGLFVSHTLSLIGQGGERGREMRRVISCKLFLSHTRMLIIHERKRDPEGRESSPVYAK